MDTKFKEGDIFLRGFAYPTQWKVIKVKLIFDIVHYELKDVRSPKTVVLSQLETYKKRFRLVYFFQLLLSYTIL